MKLMLTIGVVLLSATEMFAQPATPPISAEPPYRGLALQVLSSDNMVPYEKCIDEIKELGADTVDLGFTLHQEHGTSTRVYPDINQTPSPAQLGELIDHAHARGLRVLIEPYLYVDVPTNNEWRGTIQPDSWDDWFASYQTIITRYAAAAQAHHAEIFSVGSELVSSVPFADPWRALIKAERAVFKGRLTYQANWDHYVMVKFWNDLDLITMNSYWRMSGNDAPTVEEMCQHWNAIEKDVFAWQKDVGKPILLTEAGWCSLANAASEPWDYTRVNLKADEDLQARLYEAFFQSWHGKPGCAGYMIWEWTPVGQGDPDGKGYTPRGKKAEKVLREWMQKQW